MFLGFGDREKRLIETRVLRKDNTIQQVPTVPPPQSVLGQLGVYEG